MTVGELHYSNEYRVERYVNRNTNKRFTLDYDEALSERFSKSYKLYKKIRYFEVTNSFPLTDHDGRAVLVIEYEDPA